MSKLSASVSLAFAAGARFGAAAEQARADLAALILPLSGKATQVAVDAFATIRDEWTAGYMSTHPGAARVSGRAAWSRLIASLAEDGDDGTPAVFVRPQTPEQAKNAEKARKARDRAKADQARAVKAGEDALLRLQKIGAEKAADPIPPSGDAAAAITKSMVLSAMEAHLIAAIRAHDVAKATKLAAELAAAQAEKPMKVKGKAVEAAPL